MFCYIVLTYMTVYANKPILTTVTDVTVTQALTLSCHTWTGTAGINLCM